MVEMHVKANFQDDMLLCEYLAKQLLRGRLALILGAGISVPFGLPDWTELLKRLYAQKGKALPAKGTKPEILAGNFRRQFYQHDSVGYVAAIHKALYDASTKVDFSSLRKNATLAAIASLVMASQRGAISQVVTFNFDDLLEIYLRYHGFVVDSVPEPVHWAGYSDVTVYHPHGMVPYDLANDYDKLPVLDQESYSAIVGKEANPWHQLMLTILRRHTCLFIGLSGTDTDLHSMLTTAKAEHAVKTTSTCFWGVTFSTSQDACMVGTWEEAGIFYKTVRSYKTDLPAFLFALCQTAAKLNR